MFAEINTGIRVTVVSYCLLKKNLFLFFCIDIHLMTKKSELLKVIK